MTLIRPVRTGDADVLGELQVAAWRVAYGPFVPASYLRKLNPATKAAGWAARIADPKPGRRALVHTCDDGRPDGVVAYGRGEVFALYVHPARQRQGAGSALLRAAEDDLARSRPDTLALWTFAENAAGLAFFAAHGWRPDGATGTWLLGDRACPEVRLAKPAGCDVPSVLGLRDHVLQVQRD